MSLLERIFLSFCVISHVLVEFPYCIENLGVEEGKEDEICW